MPNNEVRTVTLLGLGFGLVGLDRWIIAPLFPAMVADLHLGYRDLGNLVGVLGVSWGLFSVLSGRAADSIGYRRILIPTVLSFAVLSTLSGLASGLVGLIIVRALMGAAQGSFCPVSFAATAAASEPHRRGFNLGLQQCGFALFGLGLGPILATQLLAVTPSWRWVYWINAAPTLGLGLLLYFFLREPPAAPLSVPAGGTGDSWGQLFRSRNIVLSMFALMSTMTCVFVMSAMAPSYLEDFLKLSRAEMGFVMSAIGFGGFFGQFGIPAISDRLGRRWTAILSFTGAVAAVYAFRGVGASPGLLAALLFAIAFFCLGNVALITGPIASESAPAGLVTSAIGIVVGAGEIFGGGVAPWLAGRIADAYGIQNILYLALAGVALGAIVCLFLRETAPRRAMS
ncbi:MAG TPA: MFS transporter [Terriglobia bacterium]|nr:MFS transporter [Terriglobia bacterium]